jgi:hypothetical protein
MVRLPLFRGSTTSSSSTSQHDTGKNVNNRNHNKPRRRKSIADILLIPPYDRHRQNQVDTAYSINRSMVRRTEESTHEQHDNIRTNNNNNYHQPFHKKDPKLPTYSGDDDDNEINNTRYRPFIKIWPQSCFFPKRSRRRRKTRTKSKVTTNNNVQQSCSPTSTLCGRTAVTDESSSTQYNCRSRSSSNNEEISPRDNNMMSSGSSLSFRDIIRFNNNKSIDKVDLRCCDDDGDNDNDKYDPDPDPDPNDDKYESVYVHHRVQQGYCSEESIKNKEVKKDDGDHDHDHNLQELPIQRSEIIGKLFPMGYPDRHKSSSEMISSADHHRQNLNSMITDESKRATMKLLITEKEEDEDYKATSITPSFGRSEIISSLFPMGHPNDIRKKEEESGSNSFLVDRRLTNKQRNILSPCRDNNINSASLKAPTFDTIATSSDVDYQQRRLEEKALETTKSKNDYDPPECEEKKKKSSDHDCDDDANIIGMVISFDPTWDLLTEEIDPVDHHTASIMVRSRLRKFHEIENYADSILGKISADESSNDESILQEVDIFAGLESNCESELLLSSSSREELMYSISDPILDLQSSENHHNRHPMVAKEKNCADHFELGFHFDSERYPSSAPSEEIEICFYPVDETSIEYFPARNRFYEKNVTA